MYAVSALSRWPRFAVSRVEDPVVHFRQTVGSRLAWWIVLRLHPHELEQGRLNDILELPSVV